MPPQPRGTKAPHSPAGLRCREEGNARGQFMLTPLENLLSQLLTVRDLTFDLCIRRIQKDPLISFVHSPCILTAH